MLILNKIYCGDNLDLLKQIDSNSINLHFTSPPYVDIKKYNSFDGVSCAKYIDWLMPRILEIERTLKEDGSFILNIDDKVEGGFRNLYVFELVIEICKQTKFKLFERLFWNKGKYLPHPKRFGNKVEFLFWFAKNQDFYFDIDAMRVPYDEKSIKRMQKPIKKRFARNDLNNNTTEYKPWNPNPLGALPSTLINIGSESQRVANNHFAVFPVKLPEYFIKGSTRENDLVCDIFNGTGTTCLAAKNLNRQYLGLELDVEYCNIATQRCTG